MTILAIIAAALLPAIILWVYIWRKDPKPEPTAWLIKATLYGAGICLPVALVEMAIGAVLFGDVGGVTSPDSLPGATLAAFIVAALPEEAFKLWALWRVLRKNPYFDEHFDGIVYAVCVGLGFAALENLLYLFGHTDEWESVALARALLAVPGHYAFAVLMGYYYSVWYFVERSRKNLLLAFLVPFVGHGIYDAIAMSSTISPIIGGVCFAGLVFFCVKMHKMAYKKVLAQIQRDEEDPIVVA